MSQYKFGAIKNTISVPINLLRKSFLTIKKHKKTIALILALGTGLAADYYYSFPDKVYQTTRTDKPIDNDETMLHIRGSTEYGIEDPERFGTNFLLDMMAGKGDKAEWLEFIKSLGYIIPEDFSFPPDSENPALYNAIRKTHQACFSPKLRIEGPEGSFKHLSDGKIAYTDHFSHIIYLYYWLSNSTEVAATEFTLKERELVQNKLTSGYLSELAHTYALGKYKQSYVNRFMKDAVFGGGASVVKDTQAVVITKRYVEKIITSEYEERINDTITKICRYSVTQDTIFDESLKSGYISLIGDYYISTKNYNKSYKKGFESRIHNDIEAVIHAYFIDMYKQYYEEDKERQMYDYARVLLGKLGGKVRDRNVGNDLMIQLADAGYDLANDKVRKDVGTSDTTTICKSFYERNRIFVHDESLLIGDNIYTMRYIDESLIKRNVCDTLFTPDGEDSVSIED